MWLFLLAACGRFVPSASLGDLDVRSVDMEGLDAELAVVVDNPLPVGAAIGVDGAVRVDQVTVAEVHLAEGQVVASGASEVVVPVRLPWAPLWAAVGAGVDVPYVVELDLNGHHPLGAWSFPVRTEGTLPGVRLPTVVFHGLVLDEVSLARVAATVVLEVDLPLEALTWSLSGGGVPLVHGALDRGEGKLRLPTVVELAHGPAAMFGALRSGVVFDLDAVLVTPLGRLPIDHRSRWPPR